MKRVVKKTHTSKLKRDVAAINKKLSTDELITYLVAFWLIDLLTYLAVRSFSEMARSEKDRTQKVLNAAGGDETAVTNAEQASTSGESTSDEDENVAQTGVSTSANAGSTSPGDARLKKRNNNVSTNAPKKANTTTNGESLEVPTSDDDDAAKKKQRNAKSNRKFVSNPTNRLVKRKQDRRRFRKNWRSGSLDSDSKRKASTARQAALRKAKKLAELESKKYMAEHTKNIIDKQLHQIERLDRVSENTHAHQLMIHTYIPTLRIGFKRTSIRILVQQFYSLHYPPRARSCMDLRLAMRNCAMYLAIQTTRIQLHTVYPLRYSRRVLKAISKQLILRPHALDALHAGSRT